MDTLETCVLSHDFPYLAALLLPFVKREKRSNLNQVRRTIIVSQDQYSNKLFTEFIIETANFRITDQVGAESCC